jgi:CBS domain-containing protein
MPARLHNPHQDQQPFGDHVYVQDIMQVNPTTVRKSDKLRAAVDLMTSNHLQTVMVVDDHHNYAGELNAFQLAKILLPHDARVFVGDHPAAHPGETVADLVERLTPYLDRPVADFMDQEVPTVHPKTPLVEALLLLRGGVLRMPVTEGPENKLVGALSVLTVMRRVGLTDTD